MYGSYSCIYKQVGFCYDADVYFLNGFTGFLGSLHKGTEEANCPYRSAVLLFIDCSCSIIFAWSLRLDA